VIAQWVRDFVQEGASVTMAISEKMTLTPEMKAYMTGFSDGFLAAANAIRDKLEDAPEDREEAED